MKINTFVQFLWCVAGTETQVAWSLVLVSGSHIVWVLFSCEGGATVVLLALAVGLTGCCLPSPDHPVVTGPWHAGFAQGPLC